MIIKQRMIFTATLTTNLDARKLVAVFRFRQLEIVFYAARTVNGYYGLRYDKNSEIQPRT